MLTVELMAWAEEKLSQTIETARGGGGESEEREICRERERLKRDMEMGREKDPECDVLL